MEVLAEVDPEQQRAAVRQRGRFRGQIEPSLDAVHPVSPAGALEPELASLGLLMHKAIAAPTVFGLKEITQGVPPACAAPDGHHPVPRIG